MKKKFPSSEINYYPNMNNQYFDNITNNFIQAPYVQTNQFNSKVLLDLRTIVKEEFKSIAVPYINKFINTNFVDKKSFIEKFNEIETRINKNIDLRNQEIKINEAKFEIDEIKSEIINIKNNCNAIFNSNRYSLPINNKININELYNDVNLVTNDLLDKTDNISSLKDDIEKLKKEMKVIKDIFPNIYNIERINSKFKTFEKEGFPNKNLLNDINKLKDDLKIIYENNSFINIDINKEKKIFDFFEKINYDKLLKFDFDKYNDISEIYKKLMAENLNISTKIKNNDEEINLINTQLIDISNIVKNLKDKINGIIPDSIHFIDSKDKNEKNDEIKNIMEEEAKKIKNEMNDIYESFIVEHNKKNGELNEKINEIKRELNEDKIITLENKMNIIQNSNNIKNNQQTLLESKLDYKHLENIIIKFDEEKIKNLENKIKIIDKRINATIDEGKQLDKLKDEINEKNKINNNEKFIEIDKRINNILKDINKFNENKIFITDDIEKKLDSLSINITSLENKLAKLEEKSVRDRIEFCDKMEISNSNNNLPKFNDIRSDNVENVIEDKKEPNKDEEEIKVSEKKEKEGEEKEQLPQNLNNHNLGVEYKNNGDNEEDKEEEEEFKNYSVSDV